MKKSIVLATAVASVLASGVAAAEFSANAAITSNYIWRGVTQTTDQAAGQGGIDWGHGADAAGARLRKRGKKAPVFPRYAR